MTGAKRDELDAFVAPHDAVGAPAAPARAFLTTASLCPLRPVPVEPARRRFPSVGARGRRTTAATPVTVAPSTVPEAGVTDVYKGGLGKNAPWDVEPEDLVIDMTPINAS